MAEQYDEKQIERLREQLSQDFQLSNPGFWHVALKAKNWTHWDRVKDIVADASKENERLDARREQMVIEEAKAINRRRAQHAPPPIAGYLAQTLGYPHSATVDANLNVSAQITQEKRNRALRVQQDVFEELRHGEQYAKLNIDPAEFNKAPREPQDLSEELDRNTKRMMVEDKQELVEQLSDHIKDGDQARSILSKAFYEQRRDLIEEARKQGEKNPERAVSDAYQIVGNSINEYEAHRLHTTFNKFGYEHVEEQYAKEEAENVITEHKLAQEETPDKQQAEFPQSLDEFYGQKNEVTPEAEVSVSDSKQQLHSKEHKQMMLEITKITERADMERVQLNTLFNDHSEEMIEVAKNEGAENPEQAVSDTFNYAMNAVDEKEQKSLSNTFKHYGHDHAPGEERAEARDLLNEQAEQQEETQEQALAMYEQKEEQEY